MGVNETWKNGLKTGVRKKRLKTRIVGDDTARAALPQSVCQCQWKVLPRVVYLISDSHQPPHSRSVQDILMFAFVSTRNPVTSM